MTARRSAPTVLPCSIDPQSWDIDEGSYRAGRDAQRECFQCPRLAACRAEVAKMIAAGDPPQSMIWAGVAYWHDGTAVATDRELRVYYNRVEGQRAIERGSAA
ncbi:hypothetical protein [Rhodococcus opacus]|uniref:hypothetical protein n=1 Tax=Rhodococcus opacus TaxID=37919 RepID=UPI00223695A5|nr:hypothetical protein [Rhodococcus opacus]UZG59993.1 hypothetical protein ONE62_40455 [Rhodococcus opacus]